MKGFIAGLVVALLLAGIVIALKGKQPEIIGSNKPVPLVVSLTKGTTIPMILGTPLAAGATKVGSSVQLWVSEDVKVDGETVIKKGTPVQGTVSWSRAEGALSGLMNRPARLAITINGLKTVEGNIVTIEFDEGPAFEFNRDNTSKALTDVRDVWNNSKQREVLTRIYTDISAGKTPTIVSDEEREALKSALQTLDLSEAESLISKNKKSFDKVLTSLAGNVFSGSLGNAEGALGAVRQLGSLLEGVSDQIGGAFRGRTIHAPAGMPLSAKTTGDVQVKVQSDIR